MCRPAETVGVAGDGRVAAWLTEPAETAPVVVGGQRLWPGWLSGGRRLWPGWLSVPGAGGWGRGRLEEAAAGGPDDGFYGGAEAETVTGGASAPAYGAFGQVETTGNGVHRETGREESQELQVVVADLAMRPPPNPSQRFPSSHIPPQRLRPRHVRSKRLARCHVRSKRLARYHVPGAHVPPERLTPRPLPGHQVPSERIT